MKNYCSQGFPWATLMVNLLGCLLFTTGLCGGFTTFSTFANEGLQLLLGGSVWSFVLYVLASVGIGIALVALGYWLVR